MTDSNNPVIIMCCFLAPLSEAIAVTALRKSGILSGRHAAGQITTLETMLWGGTLMLVVDHVLNGEFTWRYPFFTALGQTGGTEVLLKEIITVGLPMCLVITAVWGVMAGIRGMRSARAVKTVRRA